MTSPDTTLPEDKLLRLQGRFALAAKAHYAALESLDEERAAAQTRMLAAIHGALLKGGGLGKLLQLVDSDDPVVAGMAAVYALNLDPQRCLEVLQRVATEPGLLGFRAGMAVERWQSGGMSPLES